MQAFIYRSHVFFQDEDDERKDDEEEPDSDYELGGYHPVNLGDVFDSRYYILRKLGWGHFATVWLSFDSQKRSFAAIKIPKSRQDFIEASRDELEVRRTLFSFVFITRSRFSLLFVMGTGNTWATIM